MEDRPRIKILTTVFPLMEFARAVAAERGEVRLLIPPGAEVHTWQPRVSDIAKLSSSDLFICIGQSLEPWAKDIIKSVSKPDLRILEASQNIELLREASPHSGQHGHQTVDPHLWLDFDHDLVIIKQIQRILSEIEPVHATFFSQNAARYNEKLKMLNNKFEAAFRNCLHRTFIFAGHSAFGYLADKYKLEQVSIYGLSPDSEPTPKQIFSVISLAKKNRIKTIFFEANINPKLARLVAKEIGAKTLPLNPGHNLTKKQLMLGVTFFDIMEENLKNLKDGLICR